LAFAASPTMASSSSILDWWRVAGSPAMRNGRATFSATLSNGIRLKNWKTNPVLSRRVSVRRSSSRVEMRTPSMTTSPEVGRSRPPSRWSIVDLPDPELPMMATNSPRSTDSEMPLSASTSPSPSG
jgi:hypothetical protein